MHFFPDRFSYEHSDRRREAGAGGERQRRGRGQAERGLSAGGEWRRMAGDLAEACNLFSVSP